MAWGYYRKENSFHWWNWPTWRAFYQGWSSHLVNLKFACWSSFSWECGNYNILQALSSFDWPSIARKQVGEGNGRFSNDLHAAVVRQVDQKGWKCSANRSSVDDRSTWPRNRCNSWPSSFPHVRKAQQSHLCETWKRWIWSDEWFQDVLANKAYQPSLQARNCCPVHNH